MPAMIPTFEPLAIPEVVLVTPERHGDARGFFMETFKASAYAPHGIPGASGAFVQDNLSRSERGVLRGLHWQTPPAAQGKLVSALRGEILDVAVDLRRGAPTFGRVVQALLSEENRRQLWVPAGFAHGFLVRSAVAEVAYKATAEYTPEAERGLRWDDPALGIDWGVRDPRLSPRDAGLPTLAELPDGDLFPYPRGEGGTA